MTAASRTDSIERATGIPWDDWVARLDAKDCREATHQQIVSRTQRHLRDRVKNPGWWAQAVAVVYTQHVGRRAPGQRQDGTFEAVVSGTMEGTLDEVLAAWLSFVADRDTFAGASLLEDPTVSSTQSWRRWRARLDDGTRVGVDVGSQHGRTVLTASHKRLPNPLQREASRAWWRALVDTFLSAVTPAQRGATRYLRLRRSRTRTDS